MACDKTVNETKYQYGHDNTRVAIVTGCAQGMGRAVAELLARDGASVVLNDINKERFLKSVEAVKNTNLSLKGLI